jgi:hypothetical protein
MENTSDKAESTPPVVVAPKTYEDCISIIAGLESESSLDNMKLGLKKLSAFFNARVGKKKTEDERDGGAAVKRAISSGRNFKKYEAKPIADAPANSPFGG